MGKNPARQQKDGYDRRQKEEKEQGICGPQSALCGDLDVARDQFIKKLQDTYQLTETGDERLPEKCW